MLSSDNTLLFCGVTALVVSIMVILAWHGYKRWQQGHIIMGEIFALAGAFSNSIDRFIYSGVVDFIVFHVGSWAPFGVFNCADVAIVVGAFIIFFTSLKNS